MNLYELSQKVVGNLKVRNAETLKNSVNWINNTIKYICSTKNYWFMKGRAVYDLLSDVPDYTLPADYKDDYLLVLNKNNSFKILEMGVLLEMVKYYNKTSGEPERYTVNGSDMTITIFPIPNDEYNMILLYYKYLPELTERNSNNFLTENWPAMIEAGATKMGFEYLRRFNDANYWGTIFVNFIKELNVVDNSIRIPNELKIIPRPSAKNTSYDLKTIIGQW